MNGLVFQLKMGNHLYLTNKKCSMNTLSILISDVFTAFTKSLGLDVHISAHDGLADFGCEVATGLFGFRSLSMSPADTEYTYLGYHAVVSRI